MKSRLQSRISRQEAERFHTACLADTLETAKSLHVPLTLFLHGAEVPGAVQDLGKRLVDCGFPAPPWEALQIRPQSGEDLGERMENALAWMLTAESSGPGLIIGSDHPSLPAAMVLQGLQRLRSAAAPHRPRASEGGEAAPPAGSASTPDLALGPTRDGGYWCIGCVRPIPGLLRGIPWSTASVLEETRQRALQRGLRVELLRPWTDVDRPEDLPVLARQIEVMRAKGDTHTGRYTERLLQELGWMHRSEG